MNTRGAPWLRLAPPALLALLGGCGTLGLDYVSGTCTDACDKLYRPEQCHLTTQGLSQDDLVDICVTECAAAEAQDGDVGSYRPYTQVSEPALIELENAAQVEAWAKCISETPCDQLDKGYCAPVW